MSLIPRSFIRWFTFNSADNVCTLTLSCPVLDDSCETCLSGERDCEDEDEVNYALLVVGGTIDGGQDTDDVEIVALDGSDTR